MTTTTSRDGWMPDGLRLHRWSAHATIGGPDGTEARGGPQIVLRMPNNELAVYWHHRTKGWWLVTEPMTAAAWRRWDHRPYQPTRAKPDMQAVLGEVHRRATAPPVVVGDGQVVAVSGTAGRGHRTGARRPAVRQRARGLAA